MPGPHESHSVALGAIMPLRSGWFDGVRSTYWLPWWLRWLRVWLPCRRPRFNPLVGKIPLPENSMGRGAKYQIRAPLEYQVSLIRTVRVWGTLRFCVKAMPSLAESYSSSEKQLQADWMFNDGAQVPTGPELPVTCVLSENPSQNAGSNASGWMMEMANLGLRPSESRRHISRTDKEEPHITTFFKLTPLSQLIRVLGGVSLRLIEGRTWPGSQVSRRSTWKTKTGLLPPHSGVPLRDMVKGNPWWAALCAACSVVPLAQEDMTSWVWLMAWLFLLGRPEPKHRAYFLPGTHWLLHQSSPVGIFVIPILQISKLRYRGV